MLTFNFTKKEHPKSRVIRHGEHMAAIYRRNGCWSYYAGFSGDHEIIPVRPYSQGHGMATKQAATLQAEAAILAYSRDGSGCWDRADCIVEYV